MNATATNTQIRKALAARGDGALAWTGHATGAFPEARWETVRAGLVRGGVPADTPTRAHIDLPMLISYLRSAGLGRDVLEAAERWSERLRADQRSRVRCQLWGLDVRSARDALTGELLDRQCVRPGDDRVLITATELARTPLLLPAWLLQFPQPPGHAAITRVSPPVWHGASPDELGARSLLTGPR